MTDAEKHKIKKLIIIKKEIQGPYKTYKEGEIVEVSLLEIELGYIIEGFGDYAYFTKDCYECYENN